MTKGRRGMGDIDRVRKGRDEEMGRKEGGKGIWRWKGRKGLYRI